MTTSKQVFSRGVSKSYAFAGWTTLALSALMGIPPFYVILRRFMDNTLSMFQLPQNLSTFLGQLVWGGSILLCGVGIVVVWRSQRSLLQKFVLTAGLAFVAATISSFGSHSALDLLVALAIGLFSALTWWKIQCLELAPFIIYRNRNAAEIAAEQVDKEFQFGTSEAKPLTRADQIRALGATNDSMTKQLSTAGLMALGAYVVEAGVNLLTWIPNPMETLYKLFVSLFAGGFWDVLKPLAGELAWIALTCTITEIAALQLVGTEKISKLIGFDSSNGGNVR